MPSLALYLFGPPRLEMDGVLVTMDRRKSLALMVYLAVTQQTHSRDALATLFWPEASQANARAYLRNSLWVLRRIVGEDWLQGDGETLALMQDRDLWLDVAQFRGLRATCRTHGHPESDVCAACLSSLSQAATLYRGDFLAGFTLRDSVGFDEWQLFQAESLRRELTSVLESLVHGYGDQGAYKSAIEHARRWLALDPLHEPAHRALMLLYAQSGEWAASLRQYHECVRILAAELDTLPSPETTDLDEQLRSGGLPGWLEGRVRGREKMAPSPPSGQLPPHNLPTSITSFVGRTTEIAQVQALLRQKEVRLVTLTGLAGVGKTRLALKVASRVLGDFPDGVHFVSLAPVREPDLVVVAVAQVMGVEKAGNQPLWERLKKTLQDKHMLLLLDNFEHVISTAPLLSDLLATCPRLKVLVTSREVLRLQGEHECQAPPLAVPDTALLPSLEVLSQVESVQLFAHRAKAVRPNFLLDAETAPAVAQICVRLDGLPLAIELAATRIRMFPLEALLKRLEQRFEVLRGGARDAPERHHTLEQAIAWSYDLLDAAEQALFRRLAVFVGGWTLDSAEALARGVAGQELDVLEGMASLVDKSLIQQGSQSGGEPWLTMLETIREYGLERLAESGEWTAMHHAHAQYCLALAEKAEPALRGPKQAAWLDRLEREHDNLRAALRWAVENREAEVGLRLGGALWYFWYVREHYREGRERLRVLLALAGAGDYPAAQAKALYAAGMLARRQGDFPAARPFLAKSLALCRELADRAGTAAALRGLGFVAFAQDEQETARFLFEESLALFRELGDRAATADCLGNLGYVALAQSDYAAAHSFGTESLEIRRAEGNRHGMALSLGICGWAAFRKGDWEATRACFQETLRISQELGDRHSVAGSLGGLGRVAFIQEDHGAALHLAIKGLALYWELGDRHGVVAYLMFLVELAVALERPRRALRLAAATTALLQATGVGFGPDNKLFDRAVESARQTLGEEAAAAWAAGQALSEEAAVIYALTTGEDDQLDLDQKAQPA